MPSRLMAEALRQVMLNLLALVGRVAEDEEHGRIDKGGLLNGLRKIFNRKGRKGLSKEQTPSS